MTEHALEAEIDWRYGMGEWAFARLGRAKKAQISLTHEALWACFRGEIHRWPLTAIYNVEIKKGSTLWFHYRGSRRSKLVGFKFSNPKSQFWALLWPLVSGPIGMMYSTLVGAVVMALLQGIIDNFMLLRFSSEFHLRILGLSCVVSWPLGSLWSGFAVRRFNRTLIGSKSPELCQTFYHNLTLQQVPQTAVEAVESVDALHPPVVLARGRPTKNFQLLGRLEASGNRRQQVEEALMLRAANIGADVVFDLSDERIPGFQSTTFRLQGTAAKSVDQQGRLDVTAQWFADQTRRLSILLMPLGGLVLVLWIIVIAYAAATEISAQPQLLNSPQLRHERLVAESLFVAVGTVFAAWPLILLLLVRFLRWPQLLLPQFAVFATIALRGIILPASMLFGAAISKNWPTLAHTILVVIDPTSLGAMFFSFYAANRTWRIYRYYISVVPAQERRTQLNRWLAITPVIGLSLAFVASFCWIHAAPGLEEWRKSRAEKMQADYHIYLNLGDTLFAEGKMSDALMAYQKVTPILEEWGADPANPAASQVLESVYRNMSQASFQLSRLDNALDFSKKAFEIHRKRAALNAADVQTQIDLAIGHYRVGDIEQAMNDIGGAIISYDKALAILERQESSNRLTPEEAKNIKELKDAFTQLRNVLRESNVETQNAVPKTTQE